MNEDDYYYLEEDTDNRPFMEDEMQDPSNAADDEDNYDRDDVDDSYFDSDALASAGWGTDEDYGHFGYDDDGGAW